MKLWLIAQWGMLVLVALVMWRTWLVDQRVDRVSAELKAMAETSRQTCVCPDGFFP